MKRIIRLFKRRFSFTSKHLPMPSVPTTSSTSQNRNKATHLRKSTPMPPRNIIGKNETAAPPKLVSEVVESSGEAQTQPNSRMSGFTSFATCDEKSTLDTVSSSSRCSLASRAPTNSEISTPPAKPLDEGDPNLESINHGGLRTKAVSTDTFGRSFKKSIKSSSSSNTQKLGETAQGTTSEKAYLLKRR
ncbi:hypothetical protein O181_064560 [Austropuccinia psidii MF-1]|uniref:Uncharacterized protein n=1 Tax=Austropuccinia psidii MF-1 TaxID=1389203 RepID=A0A9Q3I395_9BASI|nr:hypothetical protein [Austropuccinia psidii MF-1]